MATEPEYTSDTLFTVRLTCLQHRRGYRFSLDAILLAHFVAPPRRARVLDLGAGCGIISLILSYRRSDLKITALELQPALAELIRRNVAINQTGQDGQDPRIEVVCGDLRAIGQFIEPGSQDLVVCNPPYRRQGSGRLNPDREQALARHELAVDLTAIVAAAAWTVKTGGRLATIYPAARLVSLFHELHTHGLEPKRLQMIHSFPGDEARLGLVEAIKDGGEGLRVLPPFFIYSRSGGEYTPEMARCYEP